MVHNPQSTVSKGVLQQCNDTKHGMSFGVLLKSLGVHSTGVRTTDVNTLSLQKVVDIADIAAYASIDGDAPRYSLEPTRLRRQLDHQALNLKVRLGLLDGESHGREDFPSSKGCRLDFPRITLYHLMIMAQDASAWIKHEVEVVSKKHQPHERVDGRRCPRGGYAQRVHATRT